MRPGTYPSRDFTMLNKTKDLSIYPICRFLRRANIETFNIDGIDMI